MIILLLGVGWLVVWLVCLLGLIKMYVFREMLIRVKFNFYMDNLEVIFYRDYFLFFKNLFVFICGVFFFIV